MRGVQLRRAQDEAVSDHRSSLLLLLAAVGFLLLLAYVNLANLFLFPALTAARDGLVDVLKDGARSGCGRRRALGGIRSRGDRHCDPSARWRGSPVVALTAHTMKGDRERCLEAGMDDYISKPIDNEELFRIIERLAIPALAARRSWGPRPGHAVFDPSAR